LQAVDVVVGEVYRAVSHGDPGLLVPLASNLDLSEALDVGERSVGLQFRLDQLRVEALTRRTDMAAYEGRGRNQDLDALLAKAEDRLKVDRAAVLRRHLTVLPLSELTKSGKPSAWPPVDEPVRNEGVPKSTQGLARRLGATREGTVGGALGRGGGGPPVSDSGERRPPPEQRPGSELG
jgi:hypothetical protein